jgi:hypothetical protein
MTIETEPSIEVLNGLKEVAAPQLSLVYVLSNPAMPGLVKIGITGQDAGAAKRIGQLYTTGVPVPFDLEYACRVPNAVEVERALHIAFAPHRINPRREFFQIEPGQAIAILKLLHVEDATIELSNQASELDAQSVEAGEQLKRARRPRMDFLEMGIPIGSTLLSSDDGMTSVVVVDARKVRLGDEELYLSAATQRVLGVEYPIQPSPHWTYQGRSLHDIYNETHVLAE